MFRKALVYMLLTSFLVQGFVLPQPAAAQLFPEQLPVPGTLVNLSSAYQPLMVKGLKVNPQNPMQFDFLVSSGDSGLKGDDADFRQQSQRLIKYFLACLTIPENDLWVNLSPYEKDRMVSDDLGQTELGRDLLAQDYILKQLTASLIDPNKDLGKAFWERVYKKARDLYGASDVPVNTFNKVWILADTAKVFEHDNTAFVVSSHLKVMLDEDYTAMQKQLPLAPSLRKEGEQSAKSPLFDKEGLPAGQAGIKGSSTLGSQIIREIILPEIEREVNEGKNFQTIRQIFHSFILASWYKKNLKNALLNQVYADKRKISNLSPPNVLIGGPEDGQSLDSRQKHSGMTSDVEVIYQRYLQAYKKGVFNYIKEDVDATSQQIIARKYFSGGTELKDHTAIVRDVAALDRREQEELGNVDFAVTANIQQAGKIDSDSAMIVEQVRRLRSEVRERDWLSFFAQLLVHAQYPIGHTGMNEQLYVKWAYSNRGDMEQALYLLGRYLESQGLRVVARGGGESLLRWAKEDTPIVQERILEWLVSAVTPEDLRVLTLAFQIQQILGFHVDSAHMYNRDDYSLYFFSNNEFHIGLNLDGSRITPLQENAIKALEEIYDVTISVRRDEKEIQVNKKDENQPWRMKDSVEQGKDKEFILNWFRLQQQLRSLTFHFSTWRETESWGWQKDVDYVPGSSEKTLEMKDTILEFLTMRWRDLNTQAWENFRQLLLTKKSEWDALNVQEGSKQKEAFDQNWASLVLLFNEFKPVDSPSLDTAMTSGKYDYSQQEEGGAMARVFTSLSYPYRKLFEDKVLSQQIPIDGKSLHIVVIGPGKNLEDLEAIFKRYPKARRIDVIDRIDFTEKIEKFKRKHKGSQFPEVRFFTRNVLEMNKEIEEADMVVAFHVFDQSYFEKESLEKIGENIYRMLKTGGTYVQTYRSYQYLKSRAFVGDWVKRSMFDIYRLFDGKKRENGFLVGVKKPNGEGTRAIRNVYPDAAMTAGRVSLADAIVEYLNVGAKRVSKDGRKVIERINDVQGLRERMSRGGDFRIKNDIVQGQIANTIRDLVENAIDAQEGEITIDVEQENGKVILMVSNKGEINWDTLRQRALSIIGQISRGKEAGVLRVNGALPPYTAYQLGMSANDSEVVTAEEIQALPNEELLWIIGLNQGVKKKSMGGLGLALGFNHLLLKQKGIDLQVLSKNGQTTFSLVFDAADAAMTTEEQAVRLAVAVRSLSHGGRIFGGNISQLLSLRKDLLKNDFAGQGENQLEEIFQRNQNGVEELYRLIKTEDTDHSLRFQAEHQSRLYQGILNTKRDLMVLKQEVQEFFKTKDDPKGLIKKEVDEFIAELEDEIVRLTSRIELVQGVRGEQKIKMKDLVKELEETFKSNSLFLFDSLEDQDRVVQGNPYSLISAVQNLMINGLQAGEERFGNRVAAHVVVRISWDDTKQRVVIKVTDNGNGLPANKLIKGENGRLNLFGLDNTTKAGGTGLGTTETWYAIKDMGGSLSAQNTPEGAEISIELPLSMTELQSSEQGRHRWEGIGFASKRYPQNIQEAAVATRNRLGTFLSFEDLTAVMAFQKDGQVVWGIDEEKVSHRRLAGHIGLGNQKGSDYTGLRIAIVRGKVPSISMTPSSMAELAAYVERADFFGLDKNQFMDETGKPVINSYLIDFLSRQVYQAAKLFLQADPEGIGGYRLYLNSSRLVGDWMEGTVKEFIVKYNYLDRAQLSEDKAMFSDDRTSGSGLLSTSLRYSLMIGMFLASVGGVLEFSYQASRRTLSEEREQMKTMMRARDLEIKTFTHRLREIDQVMDFLFGRGTADPDKVFLFGDPIEQMRESVGRLIDLRNQTKRASQEELNELRARLKKQGASDIKLKRLFDEWFPVKPKEVKPERAQGPTMLADRGLNKEVGGIDLKASDLKMDISAKGGSAFGGQIDPALLKEFQSGNFSGVIPVIIKITPISGAWGLLGLTKSEENPVQLAAV